MDVKFVDLKLAYSDLDEEIMTAIKDVIESRNYILGDALSDFEGAFAKYNNTKFCVGVSNGLDALTIALKAAGIQAGDEVIVSSNTFIATWLSIKKIGAIPVPVDSCWLTQNLKIDEDTLVWPFSFSSLRYTYRDNTTDLAPNSLVGKESQ